MRGFGELVPAPDFDGYRRRAAAKAGTYRISVSIVVYKNDPDELAAAIRSVYAAHTSVLCTVVDNSPDCRLRACVLENGARYVYTGRNVGFGAGHNIALKENLTLARYQLVLNPDVCFGPEVLSALCEFMDANPSVGLVMPRILSPDGKEQRLCKLLPTPVDLIARRFLGKAGTRIFKTRMRKYELQDVDMKRTREVPSLSGCFLFLRSSVLDEVGLFDERYFMYMEDVDLCRRIGARAKTVFYPRVSVTHGYAKGSYRSLRLLGCHVLSATQYFSKWGWFGDAGSKALNQRIVPFKGEDPELDVSETYQDALGRQIPRERRHKQG